MVSWGYFFAGLAIVTVAAFTTMVIFLTFTPGFNAILNSLSSAFPALTSPLNVQTFITQGNVIYMGSFDFILIGLAATMFYLAFVNEPNEQVQYYGDF